MKAVFLLIFAGLFVSSLSFDFTKDQSFNVLGSTCTSDFSYTCVLNTTWNPATSSSPSQLIISPSNCLDQETQICSSISLEEYFGILNFDTLEQFLGKYVPDVNKDFLAFSCESPSVDYSLLIENGKSGVLLNALNYTTQLSCIVSGNTTTEINTASLKVHGAILNYTSTGCFNVEFKGEFKLSNFIQVSKDENNFLLSKADLSVDSLVYMDRVIVNVTLSCNVLWLGGELQVDQCKNSQVDLSNYQFVIIAFGDGFVFIETYNINTYELLCTYVFKNRVGQTSSWIGSE